MLVYGTCMCGIIIIDIYVHDLLWPLHSSTSAPAAPGVPQNLADKTPSRTNYIYSVAIQYKTMNYLPNKIV